MKDKTSMLEQVQEAINSWGDIAKECGISPENRNSIKKTLDKLKD